MAELTITDVLAVPATGGYFADDQDAIKAGAPRDGLAYPGEIRVPAEAVSVLLRLSDGYVAHGDCVSVQYSGVGGREPRLRAAELAERLRCDVAPRLRGTAVTAFRAAALEGFGAAADYGLSQALLDAAAHRAGTTMAEVVAAEWGLPAPSARVPIYAQTGEERYANVDKMVLKEVDSLPHGLINTPTLAAGIVDYVRWVRDRVLALRRREDYAPILHFDVYGLLGSDPECILAMADAAQPFALRVEHPMDAGSREGQIRALAALRDQLQGRAQLVADEWANTVDDIRAFNAAQAADVIQIKTPDLGSLRHTVDAILDCQAHGVVAHVGGSCAETERSAQVTVHVALGAHADQLLAKPGMGVDEGLSIVRNEMERTLALTGANIRGHCGDRSR
jgi:methylaspartate ammonia-lyase